MRVRRKEARRALDPGDIGATVLLAVHACALTVSVARGRIVVGQNMFAIGNPKN
jgi:hypothetical protein